MLFYKNINEAVKMNKKILVLGMLGMFLLTGLTTVSAVSMKPTAKIANNDYPDLIVTDIITTDWDLSAIIMCMTFC